MAIKESAFESEKELHNWVANNLREFLPGAYYLPPKRIKTVSGKKGLPDGFAVNFEIGKWYILESELLAHGVWPHIAEQLTRYVVAIQNPDSRSKIRDHFFEWIIENNLEKEVCQSLNTSTIHLLQKIEVFIEGIDPEVVVFIDETDRDLQEMALALSAPVKIFRVKKYIVNNNVEYLSPDKNEPALETELSSEKSVEISEYDVLEKLGGGEVFASESRVKIYRLSNNQIINIKRSKYHQQQNCYWYGISLRAWEYLNENEVDSIVFVMSEEGFVVVPMSTIREFIKFTSTSKNEDGTIRHYHVLISPGPNPELYYYHDKPKFDLTDKYQTL